MSEDKVRSRIMEELASYYSAYYDVHKQEHAMKSLVMRCDLHVNNQKYLLFKENVLWEANCHEYVYVFSVHRLTREIYRQCEELTYNDGMKLVKPVKNHMYTYLTCVIIADETEPDAVKMLKKSNIQKNFLFSLHGWMELHTAMLDCSSAKVYSNRQGREHAKILSEHAKLLL